MRYWNAALATFDDADTGPSHVWDFSALVGLDEAAGGDLGGAGDRRGRPRHVVSEQPHYTTNGADCVIRKGPQGPKRCKSL